MHFDASALFLVFVSHSSLVLTAVLEPTIVIVEGVTLVLIDKGEKNPS